MAINQPRPHILMGKGQTVSMRDRTLREQVESYLQRMRFTVPFPCTKEEMYFGCVPANIQQWHSEGLFEREIPLPGRASNILSTMFSTAEIQTKRPNILHVSVESQEEFLAATHGNRGHEGIFWIEVPECVPVPRMMQNPFYLPDDHPFHDAINDWVEQAFYVEDEIQEALRRMELYEAVVKSPAQVIKLWPEMNNFISVRRGLSNNISADLRMRAEKVLTPVVKEKVIEQLARAVMLPEKRPPLQAWVGFYKKEAGL